MKDALKKEDDEEAEEEQKQEEEEKQDQEQEKEKEQEQPAAEPGNEWEAMQDDQGSQAKGEDDRYGSYNRKRPYEESRGYGYYEHREDKRYVFIPLILPQILCSTVMFSIADCT